MKPQFRVDVNGGALTDEIQQRLLSLRVHDEAGFSNDRMELTLDNRPPWVSMPSKGDVFTVFMGYVGQMRQIGIFEFDEAVAHGAPHELTITAHAKDTGSAFKGSQNRSWHGKTIGEIVNDIGGAQQMGAQVDAGLAGIKIDHIDQTTQSDMGFLTDLARKNNAIMKVINQKIYFGPRDSAKSMDGQPVDKVTIAFTEDTKYNYISQGRGNYSGVKARYYDKGKGKEMFAGAGDVDKVPHTIGEIYTNKEEAQKAAESLNTTLARSRETLELIIPGNPDIMAESPFSIEGFPPFIPLTWTADKTEHYMTSKGAYTVTIVGVTPNTSSGGGSSSGGSASGGSDSGGTSGGSGEQEEKVDNKELGDDGFEVTESVDDNSSLPDPE